MTNPTVNGLVLVTGNPQKLSREQWNLLGEDLYGPDKDDWTFACPLCGNTQSVKTVMDNNPYPHPGMLQDKVHVGIDDVRRWINVDCVSIIDPGVGCQWARGAIDEYYGYIVLDKENQDVGKSFKFADWEDVGGSISVPEDVSEADAGEE